MATPAEIAILRSLLEQQLGRLRAELSVALDAEAGERYRDIAGEVTDSIDEAVGGEIAGTDNVLIGREVHEVRQIEAALARIAGGSYGRCISCGIEIDFDRLAASPASERCEPCEAVHERTFAGGAHPSL